MSPKPEDKVILLVEDNPDHAMLTRRALQKSNIMNEVVVIHDGVKALDYLFHRGEYEGKPHGMPTMVLLDLKLGGGLDGLDVLKALRADDRTGLIPVIVLTSSREEQDLMASYKSGANSYIRKPVDFGQFAEAVRHLGLYWLVLNEPPPSQA